MSGVYVKNTLERGSRGQVLGLQPPLPDALGRAQWSGTDDDVARAFRKVRGN